MTTPSTTISVSDMISEFTPAGHTIRAQAVCQEPTSFVASIVDFYSGMEISNSPIWKYNSNEGWVAVVLMSAHTGASADLSAKLAGGEFVRPGMTVDDRDEVFGGKKVVSVVPYGGFMGNNTATFNIVFLRPGLSTAQLNKARAVNSSTGYWMNFHSGKISSYTRGQPSTNLGNLVPPQASVPWIFSGNRQSTNSGLIPDLPSTSTLPSTPSAVTSSPSALNLGTYRSKAATYSDYTSMYNAGSPSADTAIFGSGATASYQTRRSTSYIEFTVPSGDGNYVVDIERMRCAAGGNWRYEDDSYLFYGGRTDWRTFWKNVGWELLLLTGSIETSVAKRVDSSVFQTRDGKNFNQFDTPAVSDISILAGQTYRLRYVADYAQSSGIGGDPNNIHFYCQNGDLTFNINNQNGVQIRTESFSNLNKPDATVRLIGQTKWSNPITPSGSNHVNYNTNNF